MGSFAPPDTLWRGEPGIYAGDGRGGSAAGIAQGRRRSSGQSLIMFLHGKRTEARSEGSGGYNHEGSPVTTERWFSG